jgi:putative alpha-1,2-mannosidase
MNCPAKLPVARRSLLRATCHMALLAGSSAPALAATRRGGKSAGGNQPNLFIGTGGDGHTFPGASLPFGMVQVSPDTDTARWDTCSGYHHGDPSLLGFSHTHLSGTGIGDMLDVLVVPARPCGSIPARWIPSPTRAIACATPARKRAPASTASRWKTAWPAN